MLIGSAALNKSPNITTYSKLLSLAISNDSWNFKEIESKYISFLLDTEPL